MRKLLGERLSTLHQNCRVLVFEFDFELQTDYKLRLNFVDEMSRDRVEDKWITPHRLYLSKNLVFFVFENYNQDRTFQLEVWSKGEDDAETSDSL